MKGTMVVTFVSNYINHHQLPFCRAMSQMDGVEFHFIQTQPMEQKRVDMGWAVNVKDYPFVLLWYEDRDKCNELILGSDVTIFGWTEGATSEIEKKRLSSDKLSFRVSERIYREGQWKAISPKGLLAKYHEHFVYRYKSVFLLCAGAYVSSDFALIHCYPYSMLKWGYFPDASCGGAAITDKTYSKAGEKLRLLWAGRLIELKHPEFAVRAAAVLKEKGIDFSLDIVGDGPLMDELQKMVEKYQLEKEVTLAGGKKPAEVLEYMEKSDIFLFTSNYLEGWGAVVNEAMMKGCAVIASREAGSVPFLINSGENGLSYENGSYEDFVSKVLYLVDNRDKIEQFGTKAKKTINEVWNANNAALELVKFSRQYIDGLDPLIPESGPMSDAQVLKAPGFWRTLREKNRLE